MDDVTESLLGRGQRLICFGSIGANRPNSFVASSKDAVWSTEKCISLLHRSKNFSVDWKDSFAMSKQGFNWIDRFLSLWMPEQAAEYSYSSTRFTANLRAKNSATAARCNKSARLQNGSRTFFFFQWRRSALGYRNWETLPASAL